MPNCLNNDIMRFYSPIFLPEDLAAEPKSCPRSGLVLDDLADSTQGTTGPFSEEEEEEILDDYVQSPMFAYAQYILGKRLLVNESGAPLLDGVPCAPRTVAMAVNAHIREMGGKYLPYPGVFSKSVESAPTMTIKQPRF